MSNQTEQILLNSKKSVTSTDLDLFVTTELSQTANEMPISELNKNISAFEVYITEREKSNKYRLHGEINIIASNILCEFDGEFGWESVEFNRFYDSLTNEYDKKLEDVLFNKNGYFYYLKDNDNCTKHYLEPLPQRFNLTNKDEWETIITYPYKKEATSIKFNNIPISEGIAILGGSLVQINGKNMVKFYTPINHNLNNGDKIQLTSLNSLNGDFFVYQIGDENHAHKLNVFVVDISLPTFPNVAAEKITFSKYINGVLCKYYAVWLKKITTIDYFNSGFATNIYSDQIYSFVSPNDMNLTNYVDCYGLPLRQLTVVNVKRHNSYFDQVIVGIDAKVSGINYDINSIYNHGTLEPIKVVNPTDDEFFYGVVEYNDVNFSETLLSNAGYVFNSINRVTNYLIEGYYYYPNFDVKFSSFSPELYETIIREDAPTYAIEYNGKYFYRKILLSDNVPFLNGCHYLRYEMIMPIRRQDPCNIYGLSYNALIEGRCLDLSPTKVTPIDKIC